MKNINTLKGKLELVCNDESIMEAVAEKLCEYHKHEFDPIYDESFIDCLCDEDIGEYIIVNGCLYHILEKEYYGEEGIFLARKNSDNTIDFLVQYHDGYFDHIEAIKKALGDLKGE